MRTLHTVLVLLLASTSAWSQASHAESLCSKGERVVFSCTTSSKAVSLCATDKLSAQAGTLTYRFGKLSGAVELEYSNEASPLYTKFSFDYEAWAKGESSTVSFKRGAYQYFVNHAHGAFGVDGGPNRAGVRVLRGKNEIAHIACDEATATDLLYEELHDIGLPSSDAL